MSHTFERVSVLGLGLLGGSLCQALRSLPKPPVVVGYAHRPSSLNHASELGLADEYTSDLGKAVAGADLVVLASPVGTFESLLRGIAPYLKFGAVVTDVGSTKRTVARLASEILPQGVTFIGGHPMAGGERSGAVHARADLFHNAALILTPRLDANPDHLTSLKALWSNLGSRVMQMTPETHDRLVASVSHLPHATAAMLVTLQTPSALELSGGGYRDSTRIAAGDPDLWRDILMDNRDYVRESLLNLREELDTLVKLLEKGHAEGLREYLAAAAIKRGSPIREKSPMV